MQVWGGVGCITSLLLLTVGDAQRSIPLILSGMCTFLFAFSASYGIPALVLRHVLARPSGYSAVYDGISGSMQNTSLQVISLQVDRPRAWLPVFKLIPQHAEPLSVSRAQSDSIRVASETGQGPKVRG